MDYKEFKETLTNDIEKEMIKHGMPCDSELSFTKKPNEVYDALIIKPKNRKVGPVLRVDILYQAFLAGEQYDTIIKNVSEAILNAMHNIPVCETVESFMEYENIKNRLFTIAISSSRNKDFLSDVPHKDMEDISIIYKILLDADHHKMTTIPVTNNLLDFWKITPEQLHIDAANSAMRLRPFRTDNIQNVIKDLLPDQDMFEYPQDSLLTVVSTDDGQFGAGALAYPDFFERMAKMQGGSYYIIPSSIHELLILKENVETSPTLIQEFIKEVNQTQVLPEDVLTDSLYRYDARKHRFETFRNYRNRLLREFREKYK